MAGEFQHRHHVTGRTLYTVNRNESGHPWNGSADLAQVNANWATYKIAMPEDPANGYLYIGDHPAASAGKRHGEVYDQLTGTALITDPQVSIFYEYYWNGSVVVGLVPNIAIEDTIITVE